MLVFECTTFTVNLGTSSAQYRFISYYVSVKSNADSVSYFVIRIPIRFTIYSNMSSYLFDKYLLY